MRTLELSKRYAHLYKPSAKAPVLVEVEPMRFLMIDGEGEIGESSTRFQESLQALFSLAYSTKFEAKKRLDISYQVMPLEGLYWDADGGIDLPADTSRLRWRLMILLPDEVTGEFVDEVRSKVAAKKNPPRLEDVRVQTFSEGTCMQIMHVGPYAEETATVGRLLDFAAQKGLEVKGPHHEIYLGDPRRSAPEKLKTVLRYAVR